MSVLAIETEIKPIAPCAGNPCGPNALCQEDDGYPDCSCLPGFKGLPPNCRPECVVHPECPSYLACLNNHCRDPCIGVCGINAECTVRNHNPICGCLESYTGDPFIRCTPIPITTTTTTKRPIIFDTPTPTYPPAPPPATEESPSIIFKPIFPTKDAPTLTLSPIGITPTQRPMVDPCGQKPCGINANCKTNGFDHRCECKFDYVGNPYVSCGPECTLNSDCRQHQRCVNQKCINACPGHCPPSAECNVINHKPRCSCPPMMTGNPESQCSYIPISQVTSKLL